MRLALRRRQSRAQRARNWLSDGIENAIAAVWTLRTLWRLARSG